MLQLLRKFIDRMPYISQLRQKADEYNANACYPPGHFYSPIVSVSDIKHRQYVIWKATGPDSIEGIDLNTEEQIRLVNEISAYYKDIPFPEEKDPGRRYYFRNEYYSFADAIILYGLIRHYQPGRVIEIGSGFSSALMLDTAQHFSLKTKFTFIEPYPDRLFSLLSEKDKQECTTLVKNVQDVEMDIFKALGKGDILFIDSSHISKTGSDVNFILFHILPQLNKGVLIHFHDVFYPFEYPREWVLEGRNWNENYLLRAFLMYNGQFRIKLFSSYLTKYHARVFDKMPMVFLNAGGNLWLEKL
jgi:predicted O-methyltransferase YrrM